LFDTRADVRCPILAIPSWLLDQLAWVEHHLSAASYRCGVAASAMAVHPLLKWTNIECFQISDLFTARSGRIPSGAERGSLNVAVDAKCHLPNLCWKVSKVMQLAVRF
jgi:hypothetical protein